ncbi:MAG: regulatory protein GemA [Sphingomonadales bacterium]|nr:regulatory protein GemA [Sphingomonadales bacterium]MBD3772098.1 regulatory protein GemA [Paracoccaceae bacterium]
MNARAKPAQFDRSQQHRKGAIAKIHVGRKQLAMHEDDYRQLLFNVTGKTSLTDCTVDQLDMVVGALIGRGFRPVPKKGKRVAQHPMARKARALWISLHQLGVVRNSSEEALEAFAKRQLGCERLIWARQQDANRLIEALKGMAERAGWRQTSLATQKKIDPRTLQSSLCELILAKLKQASAVPQDWTLDVAAWRLCGIDTADTEGGYGPEHYVRLAAALGSKLRELAPEGATA